MKETLHQITLIVLLSLGFITACNISTTPTQQPETETPTPTVSSTKTVPPAPTATKTITPVPATKTARATATPKFAPICNSDSAMPSRCQLPIAEQSSAFCIKKFPTNLILINEGASYKLLHKYIRCSDEGMKNGKKILSCTGPMAFYYELRVCDSACSSSVVASGATQCPQNYHYDDLLGCCAEEPQEIEQGCVVLKLDTPSCMIDCAEFTNKTACTNYGYACRWDSTNNECYLRR